MINTVLEALREFSKVKLQTNQIFPTLALCKVDIREIFACGIRNLKPTHYQNVNDVKYSKAYSTYFFKNAFLLHIKCS